MPRLSADSFTNLVKQSGLVDAVRMKTVLDALDESGADTSDPATIASEMVSRDLLTRWQADKLLQGKHKGFSLGKYRLLGLLGKGGMSSVYLAEHVLMRRRCAIKVLPIKRVKDSSYLARFHREAQAVASLDHPNIVRAYDIDHELEGDKEIHFLVMEHVNGDSIQDLVKERGPLSLEEAADYVRQAACGLDHAHKSGLVHRDVKPGNLLVDQGGVVKVLDLGLARFSEVTDENPLTVTHDEKVLGTADYLAPEQALDSHSVDHRADIYSLGCSAYFFLTGQTPFRGGTLAQRLMWHQTKEPDDIATVRTDVASARGGRELIAIVQRMMAKKPEDRYADMDGVRAAMQQWLEQFGSSKWRDSHPSSGSGAGSTAVGANPAAAGSTVLNSAPDGQPSTVVRMAVPVARAVAVARPVAAIPSAPAAAAPVAAAPVATPPAAAPPASSAQAIAPATNPVPPVTADSQPIAASAPPPPSPASSPPTTTDAGPDFSSFGSFTDSGDDSGGFNAWMQSASQDAAAEFGTTDRDSTAASAIEDKDDQADSDSVADENWSDPQASDSGSTLADIVTDPPELPAATVPMAVASIVSPPADSTGFGVPDSADGNQPGSDFAGFGNTDLMPDDDDAPDDTRTQASAPSFASGFPGFAPADDSTSEGQADSHPFFPVESAPMTASNESNPFAGFDPTIPASDPSPAFPAPAFPTPAAPADNTAFSPAAPQPGSPPTAPVAQVARPVVAPSPVVPAVNVAPQAPFAQPAAATPVQPEPPMFAPQPESRSFVPPSDTGGFVPPSGFDAPPSFGGVPAAGPMGGFGQDAGFGASAAQQPGFGQPTFGQPDTVAQPAAAPVGRRSSTNKKPPIGLIAGGVVVVAAIIGGVAMFSGSGDEKPTGGTKTTKSATSGKTAGSATSKRGSSSSGGGQKALGNNLTVGPGGNFSTITAALDYLKGNSSYDTISRRQQITIKVTGGQTYAESIVIDNSGNSYPRGIQILSDGAPAKLKPSGGGPAIRLAGCEFAVVSGFEIDAAGKDVAVELSGYLTKLSLKELTINGFGKTGILLKGAAGNQTPDELVIENCELSGGSGGASGIHITGGDASPGRIRIINNRLIGPMENGILLDAGASFTDVRENIIYKAANGISFSGGANQWREIRIINNTFYETSKYAFYFSNMPTVTSFGMAFHRNLFAKQAGPELHVAADYDDKKFDSVFTTDGGGGVQHNWSDRSASANVASGERELIAQDEFSRDQRVSSVEFNSTSPDSDDFLTLKAGTKYASIGGPTLGGKPYIGARPAK